MDEETTRLRELPSWRPLQLESAILTIRAGLEPSGAELDIG